MQNYIYLISVPAGHNINHHGKFFTKNNFGLKKKKVLTSLMKKEHCNPHNNHLYTDLC